jgi:hypothetical protein
VSLRFVAAAAAAPTQAAGVAGGATPFVCSPQKVLATHARVIPDTFVSSPGNVSPMGEVVHKVPVVTETGEPEPLSDWELEQERVKSFERLVAAPEWGRWRSEVMVRERPSAAPGDWWLLS